MGKSNKKNVKIKKNKKNNITKTKSKVRDNKKDNSILFFMVFIVLFGLILLLILYLKRPWKRNGDIIYRGKESYEIGDYFSYDETDGDLFNVENDIKWKVLGVDDAGHLLIISSSSVSDLTLGSVDNYLDGQNAYLNGIDEMNKIAKKYTRGKGAIGARSVTVEDIINALNIDISKINIGEDYSYFWDKNNDLYYKNSLGFEGKSLLSHNGRFTYFDNKINKWNVSNTLDYVEGDDLNYIATIENNLVTFNSSIYDKNGEYVSLYEKDTKKYNMLFVDEKNVINTYWTADRFSTAFSDYAAYGFNAVKSDSLNYNFVLYSNGKPSVNTSGVRVVVMIN